ncbi:hypothetical protein [Shinella sp.]|uniref:hypothetical protein n=1 Tax=Shinella sp. TaxID=1870904 RepID=UPI003F729CE3
MSNILSTRLKRLEQHHDMGNPLAHLTDEELEARLQAVTVQIETRVGMPIADYAHEICRALDADEDLPPEWTADSAREFAGALRRIAEGRAQHGR